MISRRRLLAIGPAAAVKILVWPPVAWATSPSERLRGLLDRAIAVLADPGLKQEVRAEDRREALRTIASEMFDVAELTKRCLGTHWQGLSRDDRREIVRLVGGLIERSYMSRIELFDGERITFAGESVDGDVATVRTRIVTRQGTEVPVAYQMLRHGDRWWVYDVTIEAVSLVANYRSQFHRIIERASYGELVRRLRAKTDDGSVGVAARVRRTAQD